MKSAHERGPAAAIGETWMRFWFTPVGSRPLAVVRMSSGLLGLLLLWSYAGSLDAWFGPRGVLSVDAVAAWRGPFGGSLFDAVSSAGAMRLASVFIALVFVMLLAGVFTPVVAPVAAILWASLLNRGPMLAGPADDCLAVLLWCLAVAPAGEHLSIDRWLRDRRGLQEPQPSWRSSLGLGLVQVHGSVIALAAVLSQLKGVTWWNGTAAWWLAAREGGRLVDLTGALVRSEFLVNAVTHAITGFEVAFAVGLWFAATQRVVARIGLVAWPAIGLLAGEPLWGLAMAIFAVPFSGPATNAAAVA
jgi:hypothetical protein